MTIKVDTTDRAEQRKFGLTMAIATALLGTLRWFFHGFTADTLPTYFYTTAAAFLLLGLAAPPLLRPVFILWIKLAEVLNFIMTRLFLAIIFYAMISPVALYQRSRGQDPLKRAWPPQDDSFWEAPDPPPASLEEARRQF
jgi:hypothetical protein